MPGSERGLPPTRPVSPPPCGKGRWGCRRIIDDADPHLQLLPARGRRACRDRKGISHERLRAVLLLPLAGRVGWGCRRISRSVALTPTSNSSPQGGGEQHAGIGKGFGGERMRGYTPQPPGSAPSRGARCAPPSCGPPRRAFLRPRSTSRSLRMRSASNFSISSSRPPMRLLALGKIVRDGDRGHDVEAHVADLAERSAHLFDLAVEQRGKLRRDAPPRRRRRQSDRCGPRSSP